MGEDADTPEIGSYWLKPDSAGGRTITIFNGTEWVSVDPLDIIGKDGTHIPKSQKDKDNARFTRIFLNTLEFVLGFVGFVALSIFLAFSIVYQNWPSTVLMSCAVLLYVTGAIAAIRYTYGRE